MPRVRLLYAVGDDPAGAVLDLPDTPDGQHRAQRLTRTGYAEAVSEPVPVVPERLVEKAKRRRQEVEVA